MTNKQYNSLKKLTSCTSYNDDNPTAMIQGGGWDPQVQTVLNGLMANFGEGSYAETGRILSEEFEATRY